MKLFEIGGDREWKELAKISSLQLLLPGQGFGHVGQGTSDHRSVVPRRYG